MENGGVNTPAEEEEREANWEHNLVDDPVEADKQDIKGELLELVETDKNTEEPGSRVENVSNSGEEEELHVEEEEERKKTKFKSERSSQDEGPGTEAE